MPATPASAPELHKAAVTYNAAADHFDADQLAFWGRHGRRAIELLELTPGAQVLDVGCGTGASALPAARAVGEDGVVHGIDIADNMLARAREKAARRGLDNVRFECADMTSACLPDATFDAVVCVFTIFFAADMEQLLGKLWRAVRPGGTLLVTSWGPDAFQPCARKFADELRQFGRDANDLPRPWERVSDADKLRQLFRRGGAALPEVDPSPDRQVLRHPDDWWIIALGSGYRWDIEQLNRGEQAALRGSMRKRLTIDRVTSIDTSALHAIAVKRG